MISAIIGTVGGRASKTVTWNGIAYEPIYEGQQQTVTIDFTNWDNSTVYWTIVEAGTSISLDSRVVGGQASGTLSPGNGDSSQTINFTFAADATTEGAIYYAIRLGSTSGDNDYITQGNYQLVDSSQTPALVLDLDPANYVSGNTWPDTSGAGRNGSIHFATTSSDSGGTFVWDGSTTQAEVPGLTGATYGTITLSTWIKPTVVTGSSQTLIAKELCYKLRINGDSTLTMSTGKGNSSWEVVATATAGLLTAGDWAHVVTTVDANATRIYINGVKVTEAAGNIIGYNNIPFIIGAYTSQGDNSSQSDFFGGLIGEVKVWNYALTETFVINQYNTTAARYGRSLIPLSLDFPGTGNPYLLVSNTQSDWDLGSIYTIEFWSNGGNASSGAIRTVMSQGPGDGIDIGYAYTNWLFRNSQPAFAEPTPGVWTHVACVAEGDGLIRLYYNGEYQTDWSVAGPLNDGSSDLNIGRRAGVDGQGFYGKLAMIRISNTAKYTTTFTPTTTYGLESDTKLLLGYDPLTDKTNNHPVSVQGGLGVSTHFPVLPIITNIPFPGQGSDGDCVWVGSDASNPNTVALFAYGDLTGWIVTYSDGQGYSATVTAMNPLGYPGVTLSVRPEYVTDRTLTFTAPHYLG